MQWIYLIGHDGTHIPSTHINCSADPMLALAAHNQGKERETRKAAGSWQMLLMICVPPSRNIDVAETMQYWRSQKRTAQHRFMFGIQMAATMMLLCLANENTLHEIEPTNRAARHLLSKAVAHTQAAHKLSLRDNVLRYVQTPGAVYSRRVKQQTVPTLDTINTISTPTKKCFTLRPVAAPAVAQSDEDGALEQPTVEPRAAPATRRVKTSMATIYGVVNLQQSTAFNDLASAADAHTVLQQTAATTLGRKRPVAAATVAAGNQVLQQYGDALCVDMHSGATLANMKVVPGERDRHCICGATRTEMTAIDSVVKLTPRGAAQHAQRCLVCGRNARAYERYCIDTERAAQKLHGGQPSSAADEESDSVDLFVKTLLVSFTDDNPPSTQTRATKRVYHGTGAPPRARRRIIPADEDDDDNDEIPSLAAENDSHTLVYGSHTVSCDHASLKKLRVPQSESALIDRMVVKS